MSVSIVIDMNLSPEWVSELARHGWNAVHWSTVGNPRAEDSEIMAWAEAHNHVVFTHDLDFGAMLALTHAAAPSVYFSSAARTCCLKTLGLSWSPRCVSTKLPWRRGRL